MSGAKTYFPAISRRKFLKAAAVLTGSAAAACGRSRPSIYSYVKDPSYTPGKNVWYASACRECSAGCGTLVKTRDGRPIKVDGNPDHPINKGALCARGQASLYGQYADDRYQNPLVDGKATDWDAALAEARKIIDETQGGIAVVTGIEDELTAGEISRFVQATDAVWIEYSPENYTAIRDRNGNVPAYDLEGVDCIVSFGADYLETYVSPVEYARAFAGVRDKKGAVIHFGSRSTLTADSSDVFYPIKPGTEGLVAEAILGLTGGGGSVSVEQASAASGISADSIRATAEKLSKASAPFVFPGDPGMTSKSASEIVERLNVTLGGDRRRKGSAPASRSAAPARLGRLAELIRNGEIKTLLVHGVDPFTFGELFPPELAENLEIISFAVRPDTASKAARAVLPDSSPFESWGVFASGNDTLTLIQPTIRPLYDTRQFAAVIAGLLGREFEPLSAIKSDWSNDEIRQGFKSGGPATRNRGREIGALASTESPAINGPVLTAYTTVLLHDTTSEYNQYLQEIPDPINMTTWQTVAEFHEEFAKEHGIEEGSVVEIKTPSSTMKFQARLHTRCSRDVVAIGLGRADSQNPLRLIPASRQLNGYNTPFEIGAVSAGVLPLVTGSEDQGDRAIAQEMKRNGKAQHEMDPSLNLYDASKHPNRRWGMTIDLDKCTGCSACVAACYMENNISVVGPDQVGYGREMSWLTIQRYRTDHGMISMPVLCQQCSHAPCEPVCPVYATYHNNEGLNVQVYNRCIGTRYCSNNCPYKVRRFNWFNYQDSTPKLMLNPDISARGVGVMEKCTFCVQRIRTADHKAKSEKRDIQDGEVKTACQETCPTQAITFGDLKDETTVVSRTREAALEEDRGYGLLEDLGTEPAVTYLRRRRNV